MIQIARILIALVALAAGPTGSTTPPSPLTVHNASPDQAELLGAALSRFADVGLDLPSLDVTFHDDRAACNGFNGTFQPRGGRAVINVCNTRAHTILHELGHAWEHWAADEQARREFMNHLELVSWNDPDNGRSERGIEQAADTIAMVLNWSSGYTTNPDFVHRLCGYETLTAGPLPHTVPLDCGNTEVQELQSSF